MKYLRIHTLIWGIICLILVLFELMLFLIYNILYLFWSFEFINYGDFSYEDQYYLDYKNNKKVICHKVVRDKNPIKAFIRKFNYFD